MPIPIYTINNNLNTNDNKLLQLTTAVDLRHRLPAFPSYLKSNVKKQLKLYIKKHISFKADQKVDSPILPTEIPEPKSSVNFNPKKFLIYICLFKIE